MSGSSVTRVVRLLDILIKHGFVQPTDTSVVLGSGSELMLVWYLCKYASQVLGCELVLDGVSVASEVLSSEQYGWCHEHGFSLASEKPVIRFKYDLVEFGRFVFNKPVAVFSTLAFEAIDETAWVFNYDASPDDNMPLHGVDCSLAYVAFYAYLMLLMYRLDEPLPKLVLQNDAKRQNEREYLDILVMKLHGNCWLTSRVLIRFKHGCYYQVGWEGYKEYKRQCGLLQRPVSLTEKQEFLRENVFPGDVFLYYVKEKQSKKRGMDNLASCYPCVIDCAGMQTLSIRVYPDLMTKHSKKVYLDSLKVVHPTAASVLTWDDYQSFPVSHHNLNVLFTGICDCMRNEVEFIIPLFDDPPRFAQYLQVGPEEGVWRQVYLSTKELVYALFEDRGVEYNKERFLDKYFRGVTPMYDLAKTMSVEDFEAVFESLLVPEPDLEALRAAVAEVTPDIGSTSGKRSKKATDVPRRSDTGEEIDFSDVADLEGLSEQEISRMADAFLESNGGIDEE